ncbi:exonuclease SbcCD subunit D C-terminal domain-containing protein [uncultured Chryseobacterium sp.]|uniref:exonuclease SbcCD subunit D C-terminal domain-containing protein n=1 Tax=uncultured Chryseobacterium sp. TaxID=259322 RepID=UPI0025FEF899|nr:exonuclease SbcCD subunit D C-terminal domain-containing protein [uncultured Chryseobacterium sp.]
MKFLHTADWHIGQLFHEYDRTAEHQHFLDWLLQVLKDEKIDAVLISGDVFDISNPSAASVRMFYTFLNRAVKSDPDLQIIITAGNHDSATRLEAPKPLLESSRIHLIGWVEKDAEGKTDYEKLLVPVYDRSGTVHSWCLAVPFLRMGDYPVIPDCENPYTEGVTAFYRESFDYACRKNRDGLPVIAMGHLHAANAETPELNDAERPIMGGVECISASAFHPDLRYVALGHIHKAQKIGGKEHIRYSGSPLPMSFSEINYRHQVIVFELDREISSIKTLEVPVSVPLMRIPSQPGPLPEVLALLEQIPAADHSGGPPPYLEVKVLLDGPEPALRHKIETALQGKKAKLAKITSVYAASDRKNAETVSPEKLDELQPADIFGRVYRSRYHTDVPDDLMSLFHQVSQEVNQSTE